MLLTREYLKKYQNNLKISLSESLVDTLLDKYGQAVVDKEGHVFEYSEQDIYEQVKKSVQNYLEGGNN